MRIYEVQELSYFYSAVMSKFFPKNSTASIVAFKKKEDANKRVKKLNIEKFKNICEENNLIKYIPDKENLTTTQIKFIKDNNFIMEDNFLLKQKTNKIEEFMSVFNLNFYCVNDIELI